MKIKFIHTADLHLGCKFHDASFPRHIAKSRREEMWSTFFDIVALAKREETHFLFISGDLFESNLITLGELKRINEAFQSIPHTNVVIAPGNHDSYGKMTPYKLIDWAENVAVFKNKELSKLEYKELNTEVYGLAWKEKYIEGEFTFDLDPVNEEKNNILLLHGDIYNKKSSYLPIDKNYVKKLLFDYVALGHIHKPDILEYHIRYPGSPEPLDFGEPGTRGVILGEIEDSTLHATFVPIAKREFILEKVYLKPEMKYRDIVDLLGAFPKKEESLYRLLILGMVDSDIQMDEVISEACKDYFYVEVINKFYPDYDLDKIMLENRENIIGAFIEAMKKKDLEDEEVKNALYLGLEALLKEKV